MHITMVKKRTADGSECRKCRQVSELLARRGRLTDIDEIIWAEEGVADSPGMVLAVAHGVEVAPFFIVETEGESKVYTSALKMMADCFAYKASILEEMEEQVRLSAGEV